MKELKLALANESATEALGKALANALEFPAVVYLEGDLGAGKTTLSRGVMRGFGHQGAVKSPTYTLVEPYEFAEVEVYHFDLYRLGDPEELEFMGIREYFEGNSLCLVEWPECGAGILPGADLEVHLEYDNQARTALIKAITEKGERALLAIKG